MISKFSKNLRRLCYSKSTETNTRTKLTPERISYINIVEKQTNQIVPLQQACKAALFKFKEIKSLSKSTLVNAQKANSGLVIRKDLRRTLKTTSITKQKLYEASVILCRHIDNSANLIYIDECTVCKKNMNP